MSAAVSVLIPVYNVQGCEALLERNLRSLFKQKFWDWEAIVTDDSGHEGLKRIAVAFGARYERNPGTPGMANNSNYSMSLARGEMLKLLFMDDMFFDEESLGNMVEHLPPTYHWAASACLHTTDGVTGFNEHKPYYSHSQNTIGSPSVTIFRKTFEERFDPKYKWVLDLDLYRRAYMRYGKPRINNNVNIVIGLGEHQETARLSTAEKNKEHEELN